MKKIIIFFASAAILFFAGCKKEKTTPDYSDLLKDTEWYGEYTDKGTTDLIGYAIAFNNDSAFKFYTAGQVLTGSWSVDANKTASMRFATGAQNKWTASIGSGDTVLTNISIPAPDNFSFTTNAKKIGDPPSDVIGHTWGGVSGSGGGGASKLTLTNTGVAGGGTYTEAPYKNKIFKTSPYLFVVDGKMVWQYYNPNNKIKFSY
jgi:hypothetical protein